MTHEMNADENTNEQRTKEVVAYLPSNKMFTQLLRAKVVSREHLTTQQKLSQMKLAGLFIAKVAHEMMTNDLDEQGRHNATGTHADTSTISLVSLMLEAEREVGNAPSDDDLDRMNPADAERAHAERQRQRNYAYSAYLRLHEPNR